jgi:glycosyltransferase involved in cell wall biosynthesis
MPEQRDIHQPIKIAYIVVVGSNQEKGVLKKVAGQIDCWRALGQNVKLFLLSQNEDSFEGTQILDNVDTEYVVARWVHNFDLNHLYPSVKGWAPDVVYLRFSLFHPWLYRIVSKYPCVMEINSNDYDEVKVDALRGRRYFNFLYYLLTRGILYRSMAGFVFVSRELKGKFSRYRQSSIEIANGIDLSKYPPKPAPANERVRIVFIGSSGQRWHGVDKIEYMANHFNSWDFDIIGPKEPDSGARAPGNIVYHGYMDQKSYGALLDSADCAIGSLAIHRERDTEASPLKVREYLAFGIPVIVGYIDTDFPSGAPFLLSLPNKEDNVKDNLDAIEDFVMSWKGRRVGRDAVASIDITPKEKKRLEFFDSIAYCR